jgi:capsular polysaccharide biosynthesis protein
MQTLPLVDSYLKLYPTYTLLVPKHHYTLFVKDILSILGIHNILLLDDHTIYNIAEFANRNWLNDACIEIDPARYSIFNLLRQPLNILPNTAPSRKIYLKKDGIANTDFGNSETGILRRILNENALIDQLKKEGFEIIHVGDKLLHEKKVLLENAYIIITQLGANCMNLLFTNAPQYVLFLSNATTFGKDFYGSLPKLYNTTEVHTHTLVYENDPVHFDPTNSANSAFTVSIEDIMKYITNCN